MVTTHREVETLRVGIPSAFDFPYAPPVDVGRISILLIAGHNAALAANALRHVEVKTILFARFRRPLGDSGDSWQCLDFVELLSARLWPLLAQHESDAVVFRPFNKR
jgi:hypothetical protein